MRVVRLPYGRDLVDVALPDKATVVYPRHLPAVSDVRREIRRAMDDPTGCEPLRHMARGKSDAVVVINDITRPTPSELILEEILGDLARAGIREQAVTVVIACGNHRPNTQAEIRQLIGPDLAARLRVINHDCEEEAHLSYLGETDGGLPVWVNDALANGSLRILTGLISPHHAAGYSGGRKSVLPGVAGLRTLTRHHSFPIRPYEPCSGWMKGNPFHEEALKGARMLGVDFIVNVVKNARGGIVKVAAGELEAAHESGVTTCTESWVLEVPEKYDIVVVTPGGHPRDIDLHQAQKAMSTAEAVIRPDGIIVLIAECADGVGKFGDWLRQARSPREVIERFRREGFTPEHSSKAFMCARALERYTVIVSCTGIQKDDLQRMFFQYAPSPQAAVDEALAAKSKGAGVLVIPYGVSCVPAVGEGKAAVRPG